MRKNWDREKELKCRVLLLLKKKKKKKYRVNGLEENN
jgi:hypothetical protein